MRALLKKLKILSYIAYGGFAITAIITASPVAHASPFGQGKFGAQVNFGSATSLTVALSGNVTLNLASNGTQYTASGSHTVSVTSSDVVGYNLYAYTAGSSAMTSGSNTIPASSNSTAATLATNTWGYNLDGSSNYLGLTSTPTLIKTATGPYYDTPDTTTVTYGVVTDLTKAAGSYTVSVIYTAACLSQ